MCDSKEMLIRHFAKEKNITYEEAKKEVEFALELGEKVYDSKPREYWKNISCDPENADIK